MRLRSASRCGVVRARTQRASRTRSSVVRVTGAARSDAQWPRYFLDVPASSTDRQRAQFASVSPAVVDIWLQEKAISIDWRARCVAHEGRRPSDIG
jgi:hypothetical protein